MTIPRPENTVQRLTTWATVLVALAVLSVGCGPGSANTPPPSRAEILVSLTELVIVPGYRDASKAAAELRLSIDSLCDSSGQDALHSARQSWRKARDRWVRTEAFRFGPAMDRRSLSLVDWWPIDPEKVRRILSEGNTVSPEQVRQFMSSTQRGLGAIEYLLFDGEGDTSAHLPPDPARCQYMKAVAAVIEEETSELLRAWEGTNNEESYAGFFSGTAMSSLLAAEAESNAVRSMVFLVRTIADMRLGPALGIAQDVYPPAFPSGKADHSKEDLHNQLVSLANLYNGSEGDKNALGISHHVRQLAPETDARMRDSFQASLGAVEDLPGSVVSTIAAEPERAMAAYRSIKELQRVLNTEVVSVLGVSVGFSDTDGDR